MFYAGRLDFEHTFCFLFLDIIYGLPLSIDHLTIEYVRCLYNFRKSFVCCSPCSLPRERIPNIFLDRNKSNKDFISNELNNLCASLQKTIVDILFEKITNAIKLTKINNVVFGGGVSCNSGIIKKFKSDKNSFKAFFPKFEYTTDNAAMIAMVGYLKYNNKDFSNLEEGAKSRYQI